MPFNLTSILIASSLLFCIGAYTVLTRRNVIGILMGVELVLNAAGLNFVAFSRFLPPGAASIQLSGQVITLFIIAVSAAEVAVALAIVLALYRRVISIDVQKFQELKR